MEKVTSLGFMVGLVKRRVLCAGAIAAAVALVGTNVLADDASDIQQFYPTGTTVTYDNTSGANPIITDIASQPGLNANAGHTYTGWSVLAQDLTGSLDLFVTATTLAGLPGGTVSSFSVGEAVNTVGQWSPFHAEPELGYNTAPISNNSVTAISFGNALPTVPAFTVSQVNTVAQSSNNPAISGMFIELKNVTFSGSTGSFQSTFPTYAQANTVSESYTITDGSGSVTMFDYVTSYSAAGAFGGTAVPTGPVNVYGFMTVFPSAALPGGGLPEFTMTSFQAVPEPSTVILVGAGFLSLLAIRRRRS